MTGVTPRARELCLGTLSALALTACSHPSSPRVDVAWTAHPPSSCPNVEIHRNDLLGSPGRWHRIFSWGGPDTVYIVFRGGDGGPVRRITLNRRGEVVHNAIIPLPELEHTTSILAAPSSRDTVLITQNPPRDELEQVPENASSMVTSFSAIGALQWEASLPSSPGHSIGRIDSV